MILVQNTGNLTLCEEEMPFSSIILIPGFVNHTNMSKILWSKNGFKNNHFVLFWKTVSKQRFVEQNFMKQKLFQNNLADIMLPVI